MENLIVEPIHILYRILICVTLFTRVRSWTRIRESIRVKIHAKFHLRESMWIRDKKKSEKFQDKAVKFWSKNLLKFSYVSW